MNLKQVKQAVATSGGATLTSNLNNAAIDSGFMVSLQGYEIKTSVEALSSELLEDYKQIAKQKKAYIGFWLDNDDLYLDISINIHDKNQAIKIAQENKQLAIYDCKSGNSIYIEQEA